MSGSFEENSVSSSSRQVRVRPVVPFSDSAEIDFDEIECIPQGTECNVIDDTELGIDVIEVIGNSSRIIFPTDCRHPYLVMHLKNIGRFLSFEVTIKDDSGTLRRCIFSNKRSTAVIEHNTCNLPLLVGEGWQHLCLNLDDVSMRAFGTRSVICREVCIYGSSRVSKIFFQEEPYADIELPQFLRVVS